ncbi:unnamed protein product [Symbiodinium natans]|uniref:Pentacotripeptide-repeat region of PRORP domain-containing protein n=1 Tax=Symbiodinium natans TaxID=878477 RepID=A0A812GWA0_9DINO|nr:unnamed protein product [Symbiodinium natans]
MPMSRGSSAAQGRAARKKQRSFNGLIAAAGQSGQLDLAAHFLKQMQNSNVQPNVMYTNIISACAKTSACHAAVGWLQEMREACLRAGRAADTQEAQGAQMGHGQGPQSQAARAQALSLLRRMRQEGAGSAKIFDK